MRVRARVNQGDINKYKLRHTVRSGSTPIRPALPGLAEISPLGVMCEPLERGRRVRGPHRHRGIPPESHARRSHRVTRRREHAGRAARRRAPGRRPRIRQRAAGVPSFEERQVTLGAKNAHEVEVASGVDAGGAGGGELQELERRRRCPPPPDMMTITAHHRRLCIRGSAVPLDGEGVRHSRQEPRRRGPSIVPGRRHPCSQANCRS